MPGFGRWSLTLLAGAAALIDVSPASAQATGRSVFAGPWVAAVTGGDWSELPDKDGPDIMTGAGIGINDVRGHNLIGIEAEYGSSNADKRYSGFRAPGDHIAVQYGRDIYVGIRQGRQFGGALLAYGKAGYINGHVRYTYVGPTEYSRAFGRPGALDGFLVGGGVEYAIGQHWLVKAEYRYANFHDGLYRHQGVAGFGFRF